MVEYSVSMMATEDTYEYKVYRIEDDSITGMVLTNFATVRKMYPSVRNANDALFMLDADPSALFEDES